MKKIIKEVTIELLKEDYPQQIINRFEEVIAIDLANELKECLLCESGDVNLKCLPLRKWLNGRIYNGHSTDKYLDVKYAEIIDILLNAKMNAQDDRKLHRFYGTLCLLYDVMRDRFILEEVLPTEFFWYGEEIKKYVEAQGYIVEEDKHNVRFIKR